MSESITPQNNEADWTDSYRKTRAYTEWICSPLETDDYQLQSIVETSPPKWRMVHDGYRRAPSRLMIAWPNDSQCADSGATTLSAIEAAPKRKRLARASAVLRPLQIARLFVRERALQRHVGGVLNDTLFVEQDTIAKSSTRFGISGVCLSALNFARRSIW